MINIEALLGRLFKDSNARTILHRTKARECTPPDGHTSQPVLKDGPGKKDDKWDHTKNRNAGDRSLEKTTIGTTRKHTPTPSQAVQK